MAERALIVEDDACLQAILGIQLEDAGFDVSATETGREALRLIAGLRFRLVLLDYQLPDISGLEVLEEVRRSQPDLAVILMSGVHDPGLPIRARHAGVQCFLRKPFSIVDLNRMVDQATVVA